MMSSGHVVERYGVQKWRLKSGKRYQWLSQVKQVGEERKVKVVENVDLKRQKKLIQHDQEQLGVNEEPTKHRSREEPSHVKPHKDMGKQMENEKEESEHFHITYFRKGVG